MKRYILPSLTGVVALGIAVAATTAQAQPALPPIHLPLGHDRTRPLPPVVDPGQPSTQEQAGKAPSDAVVLFDGSDIAQWVAMNGSPTKWVVKGGAMECVPGSGYVRTLQSFGACQFHLEFATPTPPEGSSQGRGNSGLFFGMGRYEIQVLDSFENKTYADGSCGSIYNQYPPLVNASRPPGQWQTYDILWTPPQFDDEGNLLSRPRVTAFHNGVLIHYNAELVGGTDWLRRVPLQPQPGKLPIALQDHGNPVRYRNIWVRELGPKSKPEFYLSDQLLDSYCGRYQFGRNDSCTVTRRDGNLLLRFSGVEFVLFAESPTHFFAKTVDVQAEFGENDGRKTIVVTVGEDDNGRRGRKVE
ncbi:MAG: DUF1080 domain-containing protein [Verrucomicrobiae bacterium]|nr:DUF1080 domain-containing protein [Verrucomicrobiae bacterium]